MALVCLAVTVAASYWDLRERRIPNWLMGVGFLLGIVLRTALGSLPIGATGALLIAGPFLLAWLLTDGKAVGGGDVKLLAVIGVFLGLGPGVVVVLASSLAVVVAVVGNWIRRSLSTCAGPRIAEILQTRVPLAPFLAIGVLTVLLGG